ncbi:hypothetical protein [Streptococcus pneumoniae]|uniref:hypothetical protein n=1 Tax=Streptococcus pneumoniae TaxID=1313 RepID=UPI0021ADB47F|nr:hypothetical protein [Streptococcus pneumoniae]
MLVNEMEITDHRVDNLFEKGKNEIKDSIGTNSVLNKKIMTKQGSNLLMLLKNLKLMSYYQKSYLQPQNST